MVITDIKAHVLDTETPALVTSFDGLFHHSGAAGTIKYTLVRLLTDTELEGHYIVWSEVASGRPPALAEVLRAMKPLVVGEDPFNREKLWYRLGTLWYGEKGSAFAAIDVALWDLAAKAAGLPLWRYLGGYRDRIRAYASGNVPHDEGDIVRIARDLKQRGYTAMKLHPIPIELCPALRDAVGPDVDLIYDAVFAHGRAEALAVGRELERLRYFWYEAPLPPDDIEGYIDLRRRLDVPLTVELIYATQYREFVSRHAVTYLRTLSGIRGGITEMRKVAALCEAFGMSWEPHAYGGTLYQAANLNVQLATRNTLLFELPIEAGAEGHFDTGTTEVLRIDADGFVHGPQRPGLGLPIDWEQVAAGTELEI